MNYYTKDHETKTIVNGGVSASGLLGVAFIVLKLSGVIDWPWVWVLSPFWLSVALVIVVFVLAFSIAIIKVARKERKQRK